MTTKAPHGLHRTRRVRLLLDKKSGIEIIVAQLGELRDREPRVALRAGG